MGFNPWKEAEKQCKKAIDKVLKPAVKAGEDAVWKVRRDGWARLSKLRDNAVDLIEDAEKEAKEHLREAADDLEKGLTEKLPDLIEDAAEELAKKAAEVSIKEALDNAADVVEIMAPTRFTLTFGVELALVVQGEVTVSFTFPNPVAKLTEIRKWADKPPRGREQIIECIKDFGPESLSAEFKVSGNGLSAEWDGDDKYDRIDAFLAKHGL